MSVTIAGPEAQHIMRVWHAVRSQFDRRATDDQLKQVNAITEAVITELRYTELRTALERIAQAAEQYLDTEHRDGARDLELRRNLGEAATDAALVLCPSDAHAE